jgi:hypothetical protein
MQLQLGDDSIRSWNAAVVETVIAVPARPSASPLHEPAPDLARLSTDGVRVRPLAFRGRQQTVSGSSRRSSGHVPSSMKKRACVKVTDFVRLVAWPLAASRALSEALQSSIRPRGAGQSALRGSGAQSSGAAVPWWQGQTFMRARPSSAEWWSGGAGRVQVVDGRSSRRPDRTRARRPRMLETTDFAVA